MWGLLFAGILGVILLFVFLSFSNLPSLEELENPRSELASEVYAVNAEVVGRYFTENRVPVFYEDLSPFMVQALIATEDERYYQHSGIDLRALGRMIFKTIILQDRSSGGASTITQQLAKLMFTGTRSSGIEMVVQKLKEWIIAVRLERNYTKEEILAMYLNKFEFNYSAFGIKAAAETFFGKQHGALSLEETALLVGMLKNPSLFNPVRFPDTCLYRRMVVFKQMQRNGLLTQQEYDSLRQLPIELNFKRRVHNEGLAPHFRMELGKDLKKILDKDENKKSDGTKYNIYRDGLKIYTTIDPAIQRHAEEAMLKHMPVVQKRFSEEWKGLDPWTYRNAETTDNEMSIRKLTLKRLIRESDRYKGMSSFHLSDIVTQLENEINDLRLRDVDIDRITQEDDKKGTITRLLGNGTINSNQASQYRKVLRSTHFPKLKTQWKKLEAATEKAFKSPVKMKVFAYNDQMEADTVMSPLDSIKYHRMFLQTGILVVDPVTGHIKAWVGGINHKYFQYDHVRTNRQVGSTFKPFIYTTAIAQQGISPCFEVPDLPQTISPGYGSFYLRKPWTPDNFSGEFTGKYFTLKEGLRKSKNTVSVFLMKQLGSTEPVRGLIHNMGIDSTIRYANGRYRVPKAPSICLGSTDLSVMEMTGAYTTFANDGLYNKPIFISRIEDKNGRLIYQELPEERAALHPNTNYVMVEMLKYSATGLWELKSEVGGKTGTTNDFVDGWFMGITPSLVVGTWVGGEDRWIRFRTAYNGIGARMAKPIFLEFMKRLEADSTVNYDVKARFNKPPGDIGIELNCDEYRKDEFDQEKFKEFEEFSDHLFGDEDFFSPKDSTDIENEEF